MPKKIKRFNPKSNIDKHPSWNGKQQKEAKEFLEKVTNFNNIKNELEALFKLEEFGADLEIAEDISVQQIHALKRWNDTHSPIQGTKQASKKKTKAKVSSKKTTKKATKKAKK